MWADAARVDKIGMSIENGTMPGESWSADGGGEVEAVVVP